MVVNCQCCLILITRGEVRKAWEVITESAGGNYRLHRDLTVCQLAVLISERSNKWPVPLVAT